MKILKMIYLEPQNRKRLKKSFANKFNLVKVKTTLHEAVWKHIVVGVVKREARIYER